MSDPPALTVVGPGFQASSDQQANEIPVRLAPRETEMLKDMLRRPHEGGSRDHGKGGGGDMGDNDRITRLETHFEYIRKDLDELKSGQKRVEEIINVLSTKLIERISALPTRAELSSWRLQLIAICLAAIAIIIGGIIGGLGWLRPDPSPAPAHTNGRQASSAPAAIPPPTAVTPDAPAPPGMLEPGGAPSAVGPPPAH